MKKEMLGELLRIDTVKQLESRKRAIKMIKAMLYDLTIRNESIVPISYMEEILMILEGNK